MSKRAVIVTCEHASNRLPREYKYLIRKASILYTHEGYDIGALSYAQELARVLGGALCAGTFSRLLIDLNRSISNRRLFSRFTNGSQTWLKELLIQRYYEPFRHKVLSMVQERVEKNRPVLHLSCHSFTAILRGETRNLDLGILYDPKRPSEVEFSRELQKRLQNTTSMRVRCNAPYKGTADGHVTCLRKLFLEEQYMGIEFEVNQALLIDRARWQHVWLPALCREVSSICRDF